MHTTAPVLRPASPVEEDLQKLYNEVWQAFTEEEEGPQIAERDLETIYNDYSDDVPIAVPLTNSELPSQPPPPPLCMFFCNYPPSFSLNYLIVPRTANSYRPLVETKSIPTPSSTASPVRRRLPPTPASPSIAMPEPHPFYPADTPKSNPFTSYTPTTSAFDLVGGTTQDGSPSSHSSGRRLPKEPLYANEKRAWKEGIKMPTSSIDQSKASMLSHSSYSSGGSITSYSTNATSLLSDGYFRSPGASTSTPPVKTSPHSDRVSDARSFYSSNEATYDQNGHDYQIQYNQYNKSPYSQPYVEPILPLPPPPPPKPASIRHLASFDSKNPFDQAVHTHSPTTISPSAYSVHIV